jgi:hypothetical protein
MFSNTSGCCRPTRRHNPEDHILIVLCFHQITSVRVNCNEFQFMKAVRIFRQPSELFSLALSHGTLPLFMKLISGAGVPRILPREWGDFCLRADAAWKEEKHAGTHTSRVNQYNIAATRSHWQVYYLVLPNILYTTRFGSRRSQWPRGLRHERWDRGFQSYSRH